MNKIKITIEIKTRLSEQFIHEVFKDFLRVQKDNFKLEKITTKGKKQYTDNKVGKI